MKTLKIYFSIIPLIVLLQGCASGIIKKKSEEIRLRIPDKQWSFSMYIPNVEYYYTWEHLEHQINYAGIQAVIRPDWAFTIKIGNQLQNIERLIGRKRAELYPLQVDFTRPPSSYIKNFKGEIAIHEYLQKESSGVTVNMKSKSILLFYDQVHIDIRISKVHYTHEDEKMFEQLVSSIKIID